MKLFLVWMFEQVVWGTCSLLKWIVQGVILVVGLLCALVMGDIVTAWENRNK